MFKFGASKGAGGGDAAPAAKPKATGGFTFAAKSKPDASAKAKAAGGGFTFAGKPKDAAAPSSADAGDEAKPKPKAGGFSLGKTTTAPKAADGDKAKPKAGGFSLGKTTTAPKTTNGGGDDKGKSEANAPAKKSVGFAIGTKSSSKTTSSTSGAKTIGKAGAGASPGGIDFNPTFRTLFETLEAADARRVPVKKLSTYLDVHSGAILKPFAFFKPQSAASAKKVRSGSVSWRGKPLKVDKHQADFVVRVAGLVGVDELQVLGLLHAFFYTQGVRMQSFDYSDDTFALAVADHYFDERLCIFHCMGAMLRNASDETNAYHSVCKAFVDKHVSATFAAALVDGYKALAATELEPQSDVGTARHVTTAAALANIREQLALLETVFLAYYSAITPRFADLDLLSNLFYSQNFGQNQVNAALLPHGAGILIDRVSYLHVLILLEVMSLEGFLPVAYEDLALGPDDDVQAEFGRSHPYIADHEQVLAFHKTLVGWMEISSSLFLAPILLGWAAVLEREHYFARKSAEENNKGDMSFAGGNSDRSPDPHSVAMGYAIGHSAFDVLIALMQLESSELEGFKPNSVGFKSVLKGLLFSLITSFGASSLVAAAPSVVEFAVQIFDSEPDLVRQFWHVDFHSSTLRSLYDTCVARFPVQFYPLCSLLRALASDPDCARIVTVILGELDTLTAVVDDNSVERYSYSSDEPAYPYEEVEYYTLHDIDLGNALNITLPAGTVGVRLSEPDMPLTIQFHIRYSAWHVLYATLAKFAKSVCDGAPALDLVESVTCILQLMARLLEQQPSLDNMFPAAYAEPEAFGRANPALGKLLGSPAPIKHFLPLLFPILSLCGAYSDPPLDMLTAALSCVSYFALAHPTEVWERLQYSDFLPSYAPQEEAFATGAAGGGMRSALQRILHNTEVPNGEYSMTLAFLDLISTLLVNCHLSSPVDGEFHSRHAPRTTLSFAALAPAVDYLRTEVFAYYDGWRYRSVLQRWEIGTKILAIFAEILYDTSSDDSVVAMAVAEPGAADAAPFSLKDSLVDAFMHDGSLHHALLTVIGMGPHAVEALFAARRTREAQAVEAMIISAFEVLHFLLFDPSVQEANAALRTSLLSRTVGGDELSLIAAIASYINYPYAPRVTVLAVDTLSQICTISLASRPSPSILGYFGADAPIFRDTFVNRLKSSAEDEAVRIAILNLMSTALETQPGLAQLLLNDEVGESGTAKGIAADEKAKAKTKQPPRSKVGVTSGLSMITKLLKHAPKAFTQQPRLFERALALLYSLWGSSHSRGIIQVLRELPDFWRSVCAPLLGKPNPLPDDLFKPVDEGEGEGLPAETAVSRCYQLACQTWALQIVALELYHRTPFGIDASLVGVINELATKTKWEVWMKPFMATSFEPSVVAELRTAASRLGISLGNFKTLRTPSHSFGADYVYDTSLLAKKFAPQRHEDNVRDLFELLPVANLAWSLADAECAVVKALALFMESLVFRHPWLFTASPAPKPKAGGADGEAPAASARQLFNDADESGAKKAAAAGWYFNVLDLLASVVADHAGDDRVVEAMLLEIMDMFLSLISEWTLGVSARLSGDSLLHDVPQLAPLPRTARPLTAANAAVLVSKLRVTLDKQLVVYRTEKAAGVPPLLPPLVTALVILLRYTPRGAESGSGAEPVPSNSEASKPFVDHELLLPLLCETVALFAGDDGMLRVGVAALDALLSVPSQRKPARNVEVLAQNATVATLVAALVRQVRYMETPDLAEIILDMFLSFASSAAGAAALVHEGLLAKLASHPLFGQGPGEHGLAIYLESGERNGWHAVWCQTLALVTMVLQSLPFEESVADAALEFVALHQHALARALFVETNPMVAMEDTSPNAPSSLTLAKLEEMQRVAGLLYVLSQPEFVQRWQFVVPGAAAAHQARMTALLTDAVHLLRESGTLAALVVPVTHAEYKLSNRARDESSKREKGGAAAAQTLTRDRVSYARRRDVRQLLSEEQYTVGGLLGTGKPALADALVALNTDVATAARKAPTEAKSSSSNGVFDANPLVALVQKRLLVVLRSCVGVVTRLAPDVRGMYNGDVLLSSVKISFAPRSEHSSQLPSMSVLVGATRLCVDMVDAIGDSPAADQAALTTTKAVLMYIIENCTYVLLGHIVFFVNTKMSRSESMDVLRNVASLRDLLAKEAMSGNKFLATAREMLESTSCVEVVRSRPKSVVAGMVAVAALVRSVGRYLALTPTERWHFWRGVANLRRFSPVVVANTLRWACSVRGLRFMAATWGLVDDEALAAAAVPLPARAPVPDLPIWIPLMYEHATLRSVAEPDSVPAVASHGLLGARAYARAPDGGADAPETVAALRLAPMAALTLRGEKVGRGVMRSARPFDGMYDGRAVAVFRNTDAYHFSALWTELPGCGLFLPWAVDEAWEAPLAAVLAGDMSPAELQEADPVLYTALRRRWVLATPAEWVAAAEHWEAIVDEARAQFAATGWVLLEGLLPAEHFAAVRLHCRMLFENGASLFRAENGHSKFRWTEPVATYLNNQLTPLVARIVGEPLVPARPITHWYLPRSSLLFHIDGMPYTYSMSLNVDEVRDADAHVPSFSFSVITNSLAAPVADFELPLGVAILFKGSTLPHYRDVQYSQTQTSMSWSFDRVAF
ncbi:uncharacterized protein AMSG_11912 [Thecamonas trahens ATCC 50062]|uniref:Nucleoporin NUP188 n=1 Tax=Thecamonas trahens ATCC 50062 TaxID=461836 RepID=A0A0L0DD07_THETB|nr:hypothetical protein AMSG_11912 [Thecamonas trahens ATCC 50062]KNC50080.1 hypothetical protein AMSG_11912 [Thecamonas trahens ATCC 50062]|eukprot:XP_013757305.1 hypothetical protein AMSG_11912 [Thecamonas trahens ATCC 50062]